MVNLIVGGIMATLLTALVGLLAFSLLRYKLRARQLQEQLTGILEKDPLQLDLELATTEQILGELRKRPQPPFVLLLPKFEPLGMDLDVEVHNLPPHIALGLLKMAHKLAAKQHGQGVDQADIFLELPPEE